MFSAFARHRFRPSPLSVAPSLLPTILKIGLLTGGIVVAFTIAEVGLRLFAGITSSEPGEETAPSKPGFDARGHPDRVVPARRRGSRTIISGWTTVRAANQLHWTAGPEVGERQAGELRTLFLGDSFTMAHRQPEEDTFVGRSAALFERELPFPVKCINGGVNGYITCQELAYYRYLGRKLKPDLVVLCFFLGNDFRDNMIGTRQARSINPVLIPTFERFVKRHQEPFLRRGDTTLRDPISGDFVLRPSAE